MPLTADISWLAALVATVVLAALGGLYFTVLVPGPYARALGRQGSAQLPPSAYAGQLVATLLVVLTSAVLLGSLGIDDVGGALVFGLLVGVGYLAAMTLNIAINPNFPHPFGYTLVNAPYFVVSSLLASVLLVLIG